MYYQKNLVDVKTNLFYATVEVARKYQSENNVIIDNDFLFMNYLGKTFFDRFLEDGFVQMCNAQQDEEIVRVPYTYNEQRVIKKRYDFERQDYAREHNIKEIKEEKKELDKNLKHVSDSEKKRIKKRLKEVDNILKQWNDFYTDSEKRCIAEIELGKSSNEGKTPLLTKSEYEEFARDLVIEVMDENSIIERNKREFCSDEDKFEVALDKWISMLNYENPDYALRCWSGWLQNVKYAFSHTENTRNFLLNVWSDAHSIGKSEIMMILAEEISKISHFNKREWNMTRTTDSLNKWVDLTSVVYFDELPKSGVKFDTEFVKKALANNPLEINRKFVANDVKSINHSGYLASANHEFFIAQTTGEDSDCRICNLQILGESNKPKYIAQSGDSYEDDIRQLAHDLFYYAPFEERDMEVLKIIGSNFSSTNYKKFVANFKSELASTYYKLYPEKMTKKDWLNQDNFFNVIEQCIEQIDKFARDIFWVGSKKEIAKNLAKVMCKGLRTDSTDFQKELRFIVFYDIFQPVNYDVLGDTVVKLNDTFINDVVNHTTTTKKIVYESISWSNSPAHKYSNKIA